MRVRTAWMMAAGACSVTAVTLVIVGMTREPAEVREGPDVVVVLVDTLRADRLGTYGADRPGITPHLDAFAEQAVVFEDAISPNAWTVPSVASLFTGLHPQAHRVLRFRGEERVVLDTLAAAHETLAERFSAHGYRTAALLKSVVISPDHGFAQGFDTFRVVEGDQAAGHSAEQLTDAAIAWLDDHEGPSFLYLHYMDPHTPYQPPDDYGYTDPAYAGGLDGSHSQILRFKKGEATPTEADVAHLRALYDAEVHYLDAQLGRLLEHLPDDAVVAVTADHGEQLFEHGGWFHEHLYQENVHVPLLVRAPGLAPGRVGGWVSTIDLGPTVLELAGLDAEGFGQARSRVDAGRWTDEEGVFSEYGQVRGAWDGARKLVIGDGSDQLYDLVDDPGERRDLAGERPGDVATLRQRIEAHLERTRARAVPSDERPVAEERIQALRELGYLD